jgi:hypothetical protein
MNGGAATGGRDWTVRRLAIGGRLAFLLAAAWLAAPAWAGEPARAGAQTANVDIPGAGREVAAGPCRLLLPPGWTLEATG